MSKDARNRDLELTAEEKKKFGELVALRALFVSFHSLRLDTSRKMNCADRALLNSSKQV